MRGIKQIPGLAIFVIAINLLAIFMIGCGQQNAGNEKLKAAYIQAVEEAYNKGEVNALDTYFTSDFVRHNPPEPDIKGLENYKQSIVELRRVYSDVQLTANSTIMEGNISATRWTFQATEMSTGRQIKFTGCVMNQWANGKVVEYWHYGDALSMFQQLGYKMTPPITETTFARVTTGHYKPEKVAEAIKIYKESVVAEAKKQKGFRGTYCLSDFETGINFTISFWDSEADAIANEQSGYYIKQADKFKNLVTKKLVREGYTVTVQE